MRGSLLQKTNEFLCLIGLDVDKKERRRIDRPFLTYLCQ